MFLKNDYGEHSLDKDALKEDTDVIKKRSQALTSLYTLDSDEDLRDITDNVLDNPQVKKEQKQDILKANRRIFLFTYPSDGLLIKGTISFVPLSESHSLIFVLRGGSRDFGIPNPGGKILCPPSSSQYTTLSTTYRGGVSEGEDEYGGADVNDVKNLVDYLPELERKLKTRLFKGEMYLIGCSRGGMQLFLTLSRFPDLQKRFSKVVVLSGLLDMQDTIVTRDDLREMFIDEFRLKIGVNEKEWIETRDPMLAIHRIDRSLPILIIQGTDDKRVTLEQGYHIVDNLQQHGHAVEYWEIEGGDHCLENIPDIMQRIDEWFKYGSKTSI